MATYKGKISEIVQETPLIKVFKVKLDKEVFDYKPGQFVMLSLACVLNVKGVIVKRSYSVASSPLNKDYLEFCIAIKPGGKFTPCLDKLETGDELNLEGPFGHFYLKEHAKGVLVFIASGAGIAPLLSMIRTLLGNNKDLKIVLLYGFRNPEDCAYYTELKSYSDNYPNFTMYRSLSAKVVPDTWKEDVGRVTKVIDKYVKAAETEAVYICGKPEMVKDTVEVLKAVGIPDSKIFKEQW